MLVQSARMVRADLYSCTENLKNARYLLFKLKNNTDYSNILTKEERESLNYHVVRHKQEMKNLHNEKLDELRAQLKGTSGQLKIQKQKWSNGTPCLVESYNDIKNRLEKLEHIDINSTEFLTGDYLREYDTMSSP